MSILQQACFETDFYNDNEHLIWKELFARQMSNLADKANPLFFYYIDKFNLPKDKIPTLKYVSDQLYTANKWSVESVDGLIGYEPYFTLLKARKFPVANFIRSREEFDLCKDPDIFHEIFGHCTMLLSPEYADFLAEYANFALTIRDVDRPLFARLIWFTTETGLLKVDHNIKIFGSSILSSYKESNYCLQEEKLIRKSFDIVDIFRQPYRADMLQNVYYIIESINDVYNILSDTQRLFALLSEARKLGEYEALFPVEMNKYSNVGHCYSRDDLALGT